MTIHRSNDLSYFTFPALEELGVVHGIFMRQGGVSNPPWDSLNLATSVGDSKEHVIENRKRITQCLGLSQDSIYDVWQVHSNTVIFSNYPRDYGTPHKKGDAIISNNPDVTLMMLFADCVPILLYDWENNISAIAHAGWQGTVNKVVKCTIEEMVHIHKTKPEAIIACIGPSICKDHYPVGKNVFEAIINSFESTNNILCSHNGQYHLNLQEANRQLIVEAGVKTVFSSGICTAEHSNDWFSHRAENGKTGRFAAVISSKK